MLRQDQPRDNCINTHPHTHTVELLVSSATLSVLT